MGNGFVTDPPRLKAAATALYRLKGRYDEVTLTSPATGEALGSGDVEAGMEAVRTTWSRKHPGIGGLLDQLSTGLFAAAREYGWTEEQARKDAADQPGGTAPGGTAPGAPAPGAPAPGGSISPGDPTWTGAADDPRAPGDSTTPGDPTTSGQPVDTDGDGTPDYQDTDSDDDGIPDSVEKDGNPDARVGNPTGTSTGDGTAGCAGAPYDAAFDGSRPAYASDDVAPSAPTGPAGGDAAGAPDTAAGARIGVGSGSAGGGGSPGGGGTAAGPVPAPAAADPGPLTGGGSVGSGSVGSGSVGLGGAATGGGAAPAADRGGLPVAAAVAPVGLLGAAGAAAWAVHRKRSRDDESPAEEDDEL